MARTLKTTGIAADAIAVLVVDEDGATLIDAVSGNSITVDSQVGFGSDTWNGQTLPWFETKEGVDGFNFYGVTYGGTKPTLPYGTEVACFFAVNEFFGDNKWIFSNTGRTYGFLLESPTNKPQWFIASGTKTTGATAWTTATKLSTGAVWRRTGTTEIWYGAEGGSIASDATGSGGNFGSTNDLASFGGAAGGGYVNARFHVAAWFSRAPTSTEWADLHSDPIGTMFEAAGGGITLPVGQSTETDSALAVARSKARSVGLATETSSALPISAGRAKAIGQASETDTAQAVARSKTRAVGPAIETDTAQPITVRRTYAVGTANETDAALPVGRAKTKAVGIATETDEALPVTSGNAAVIGQATETDTALPVGRRKVKAIGVATETDAALPIRPAKVRTVGAANETDLAFAAGVVKQLTVGQAIETDAAVAVAAAKRRTLGLATETDLAIPLVPQGLVLAVGTAQETNSARPITWLRARPAIARSGGAVTSGGGSTGPATARASGSPAVPR